MTLIVRIPYKTGIVFVADRQNSYGGERAGDIRLDPVDKTLVEPARKFAIASAGETSDYKHMYKLFRENTAINAENVKEQIFDFVRNARAEYRKLYPNRTIEELETFVVVNKEKRLESYHLIEINDLDDPVKNNISGLKGRLATELVRLELIIENVEKDDAINLGVAIIQHNALNERLIGSPNDLGVDIIVADAVGIIKESKEKGSCQQINSHNNLYKHIGMMYKKKQIKCE